MLVLLTLPVIFEITQDAWSIQPSVKRLFAVNSSPRYLLNASFGLVIRKRSSAGSFSWL